jgi:hypothetical protein
VDELDELGGSGTWLVFDWQIRVTTWIILGTPTPSTAKSSCLCQHQPALLVVGVGVGADKHELAVKLLAAHLAVDLATANHSDPGSRRVSPASRCCVPHDHVTTAVLPAGITPS